MPQKWIVACKQTGTGSKALVDLGRYLYRGVIREKDILSYKDGNVTFRYQNSKTKRIEIRTVSGARFLWLVLQHIFCLKGFDAPEIMAIYIPIVNSSFKCYIACSNLILKSSWQKSDNGLK